MNNNIHRIILSYLLIVSSIVMAFIGLFLPPEGEIDHTILYFTSSVMLVSGAFLGVQVELPDWLKFLTHKRLPDSPKVLEADKIIKKKK